MANFLSLDEISDAFTLPLSIEAFSQLSAIQSISQQIELTDSKDTWKLNWGPDISASRAYSFLIRHRQIHEGFLWPWKCFCQPKHKVFFWLLLRDRLSTRNILRRKNMHLDSFSCVLCQLNVEETVTHLFLDCSFARSC